MLYFPKTKMAEVAILLRDKSTYYLIEISYIAIKITLFFSGDDRPFNNSSIMTISEYSLKR